MSDNPALGFIAPGDMKVYYYSLPLTTFFSNCISVMGLFIGVVSGVLTVSSCYIQAHVLSKDGRKHAAIVRVWWC